MKEQKYFILVSIILGKKKTQNKWKSNDLYLSCKCSFKDNNLGFFQSLCMSTCFFIPDLKNFQITTPWADNFACAVMSPVMEKSDKE